MSDNVCIRWHRGLQPRCLWPCIESQGQPHIKCKLLPHLPTSWDGRLPHTNVPRRTAARAAMGAVGQPGPWVAEPTMISWSAVRTEWAPPPRVFPRKMECWTGWRSSISIQSDLCNKGKVSSLATFVDFNAGVPGLRMAWRWEQWYERHRVQVFWKNKADTFKEYKEDCPNVKCLRGHHIFKFKMFHTYHILCGIFFFCCVFT